MTTELQNAIREIGLRIDADFVPQSKSRNAGKNHAIVNWRVRLYCDEKLVLETDYSEGIGNYAPYTLRKTVDDVERERSIAETGKDPHKMHKRISGPSPVDVIACLTRDYDALDYNAYETWAESYGYDEDSRNGEAVYKACIKIALQLRNGVGEDNMRRLVEASADW